MTLRDVSLDDKYSLQSGRIYITGTQALVRLPMMQHLRDKAAGLLPLARKKVEEEERRIAGIKRNESLRPGWLDGALRAAGVLKEGETL